MVIARKFYEMDMDHNGELSKREWGTFVSELVSDGKTTRQLAAHMWSKLDKDHSGTVTVTEFMAAYGFAKRWSEWKQSCAETEEDKSRRDSAAALAQASELLSAKVSGQAR